MNVLRAQQNAATPEGAVKRLSISLPEKTYENLHTLSSQRSSSMTEAVRLAIGLLKLITEESQHGHKFLITTSDGHILKEVILPE